MEDKRSTCCDTGKTLNRKRQSERLNRIRYNYTSPANTQRESERYSLSDLRETRSSMGIEKPRIRPRTRSSSRPVLSERGPRLRKGYEESFLKTTP